MKTKKEIADIIGYAITDMDSLFGSLKRREVQDEFWRIRSELVKALNELEKS